MPLIQICAELGKKFPYSGGLFHYAREAVGEWGGYAVTALVCGSSSLENRLLPSLAESIFSISLACLIMECICWLFSLSQP
jgi:amino acid transporter